jgi:hypothetical protein
MNEQMNERDPLTRLLGTPGQDSGCEGGMAVIAEYVELELAGRNADDVFPGLAAHLRNCPACAEDYEGLVALVRGQQR